MNNSIHSPEFQLLMICARQDHPGVQDFFEHRFRSHLFSESLFLQLVKRHRLEGLVSASLRKADLLSDATRTILKQLSQHNSMMALSALDVMRKLQEFFDHHSIRACFLKGVGLSHVYYGDVGLRQVYDIDVWVESNALSLTEAFIRSLGYANDNDRYAFNSHQLRYLRKCGHDEVFVPHSGAMLPVIELHWKLRDSLGNFLFDPEHEFDQLQRVPLGSFSVRTMNHVDQFIFLCVHGADHGWFRLKWLMDLYWLNAAVAFEESAVMNRARQLKADREVVLARALMKEVVGIDIFPHGAALPVQGKLRLQLNYILHLVTYSGVFCDTAMEKLKNAVYTFSISRKCWPSSELIKRNMTNKTDWLILPLPESFFFLYFPLRPLLWVYRKCKQ